MKGNYYERLLSNQQPEYHATVPQDSKGAELMEETKLFKTDEIGRILKVGPETVALYASQGRFPGAFKIGNEWRIPEESLAQFVRDQQGIKNPESSPNAIAPRTRRARNRRKATA